MAHSMANGHRGEISAQLGGKTYVLCLSLQGLAELEELFGVPDLLALAKRLESGTLSARQIIAILGIGLRCAGQPVSDQEVGQLASAGGVAGYIDTVSRLLQATFGEPAAVPHTGPASLEKQTEQAVTTGKK